MPSACLIRSQSLLGRTCGWAPSALVILGLLCCLPACAHEPASGDEVFQAWVADPHHHIFHGSFARNPESRDLAVEAARNEVAIAQLAVRSGRRMSGVSVSASSLLGPNGTIPEEAMRVRYPRSLPVDENGQWTPDALIPAESVMLEANQTQAIWVDVRVPEDAAGGEYSGRISIRAPEGELARFSLTLRVLDFSLPPVTQDHFYLNILIDPGSIARLHQVERWSEQHWELTKKYIENWAGHSQDAVNVFLIEDPWEGDTGFPVAGVLDWRLPGEWEQLEQPRFEFDYGNFDRFIQLCMEAGIDQNIQCWSPVMMPHRDYSVITYQDTRDGQTKRLRVEAGTPAYQAVWSQFAESFQQHLEQQGWLEITTVGLDEISTANLDKIVPIFQKIAPRLQLMVSGGDELGKYTGFSPEMAFHYGYINSEVPLPDRKARRAQGKRTLMYTANTPLYPNTFLFSEPLESRMLPWLVWKYDFDGYIRWAWNFWFDGFWEQPAYKWRSGDMFFVYPGEDGPLDSIRSEMLLKGAQDFECLWMIRDKLDALNKAGRGEETRRFEARVAEAIETATQQVDPVRPYRPLPSDLAEARKVLNQIVLELGELE